MNLIASPVISTLLALAIYFLGLSIVVQVFQELWKFLTRSQNRGYRLLLTDYLGPVADAIYAKLASTSKLVRGPLKWLKQTPAAMLARPDKTAVLEGLEALAPAWVKTTLSALNNEVARAAGGVAVSLKESEPWKKFLKDLSTITNDKEAVKIVDFLKNWGHSWTNTSQPAGGAGPGDFTVDDPVQPAALLDAFRKEFLQNVEQAAQQFAKFETNYEYSNKRRNTRQTFIIAFMIAIACDLPFEALYKNARSLEPDQAAVMAETTLQVYGNYVRLDTAKLDTQLKRDSVKKIINTTVTNLRKQKSESVDYLIDVGKKLDSWKGEVFTSLLRYLLGCVITAFFVCFGAPFWNDLAAYLLAAKKNKAAAKTSG
jgi:hypothetical protein